MHLKRISILIVLAVAGAVAQEPAKPAPAPAKKEFKSVPIPTEQALELQHFQDRVNSLQQENRAVQAEIREVQASASDLFKTICSAAGGSNCQPNMQDADPKKWTVTVMPDPPKAPAK